MALVQNMPDIVGDRKSSRMSGTGQVIKGNTNRRRSKLLYHMLALAALGLLFTAIALAAQPFSFLQSWLSDQLFIAEPPSPNIVIIGIDDATLQTYGKWSSWSRALHARAIDNLAAAGAKVIGFDVLFVDSSPDDALLAGAIENAGNVVLPVAGIQPLPLTGQRVGYEAFLVPVSPIGEVALGTGHVNIIPDRDGTVRSLPLVVSDSAGGPYPCFALAALQALFAMPLPDAYPRQDGALTLLARQVPVDGSDRLRINYAAEAAARPYLSYGAVIRGDFDPAVVRNRIALVGMTATGEGDSWEIPTSSEKVPGVFIQAAAMDTILRSRFLTETGAVTNALVMLLLVAIIALALPRLGLKWGSLMTAVLLIAYLGASFVAFDRGHILNLVYPPALLVLGFVGSITAMVVIERSDKRFVKDLFGRYVSPQVADQILRLADDGRLQLGGEEREATVLFADIRGFTRLSETMAPGEIVNMLNTYLSIVIERILQHGGMINKFAGDSIMAVWNTPQVQPDHARLAARAACDIQQAVTGLQKENASLPRVQFGIGINTGQAVAGNLGSAGRTEYTVIGDAVNLAARICSATPGTEIWIGPETYRQVEACAECVALLPQTFKGKAEPVAVYRLVRCTD
jgi:adenylate cyclase